MILSNCTKQHIDEALEVVNRRFNGNIGLNNYQQLSKTGLRHRVTLRVLNSREDGAHLSRRREVFGREPRHTISACWHAHGYFFDALPFGTRIETRGHVVHAGDMWDDFDVGSQMLRVYASDSCECS